MSSATSLTEAVKQAATQSTSLTDAVKEAARSGGDATVVNFPRIVAGLRHEAGPIVRLVKPSTNEAQDDLPEDSPPAGVPWAARRAIAELPQGLPQNLSQDPEEPLGERRQDAAPAAPRKARPLRRARRPGLLARARQRLLSRLLAGVRGALPSRAALQETARAIRRAAARLAGVLVLCALSLVVAPSPVGPDQPMAAALQKRVALVIGNSAYRYTRRLDNPRNDAMDVGAALRRLGFHVIEGFDLDKPALDAKIREFTAFLHGAHVGVFFYAGHGLHVSGQNYLVPVDARLSAASAPDFELVRLDLVHRTMEREARTSILFFDACRDSPLSDNLARAMGTRSAEVGRGLAVVQGGAGTLISFSTQPGTVALDGKGRNSPYSSALVRQLATSHEDLSTMMIAVRNEVMKKTDHRQVPWEHSALTGRFYFNPPPDPASPAPAADARVREASDAWSAAKDTRSLAVLDAFIARYGDTFYAELARARVAELRRLAPSFD